MKKKIFTSLVIGFAILFSILYFVNFINDELDKKSSDPFDSIVDYDTLESVKLAYWTKCNEDKDETKVLRYMIREYYGTEKGLYITFNVKNKGCGYIFRYPLDLNKLKVDVNNNIHYTAGGDNSRAYFDEYIGELHCTDKYLYKYASWTDYSISVYMPEASTVYYIKESED